MKICKTPKQKEFVGHGNFVKWIENNLDIDDNTVYRYIKLYSYADKIPILGNLQDAYKQIETIEEQAKMTLEMLTGICFDDCTDKQRQRFSLTPQKEAVRNDRLFLFAS